MTEQILTAIIIALVSGIVGNVIGTRRIVGRGLCDERRLTCSRLLIEKIGNLDNKVEALIKMINEKKFGLVI